MNDEHLGQLRDHGYCIVPGLLAESVVGDIVDQAEREFDVLGHMAQSKAMWSLRTRPELRRVFESIYATSDLIVSFDGMTNKPPGGSGLVLNYHVDQTQSRKSCVQAVVALKPSNAATGSLCLLKGSHREHAAMFERYGVDTDEEVWQFLPLEENDPLVSSCETVQPSLEVGDVVLWDSRTVHAVTPPRDAAASRLVAYVCMVPRTFASARTLERRRLAFESGMYSTHWPHLFVTREDVRNGPTMRWADAPAAVAALV